MTSSTANPLRWLDLGGFTSKRREKTKQIVVEPKATFTLALAGSGLRVNDGDHAKESIEVHHDYSAQHTISWRDELILEGRPEATLPPARCNLYHFPTIFTATDVTWRLETDSEELEVLTRLFVLLATVVEEGKMFQTPDNVGAYPIHALLVGNTEEALTVGWKLFEAVPKLLTQTHTTTSFGLKLFNGESSLHIVIVNRREGVLLRMLDLAEQRLTSASFAELLNQQPEGVFFRDMPMLYYGSTALSFACCFGLKRAVSRLLATRHVSLNDPASCAISGFAPIHAVVANRNMEMLEYLTSELPPDQRASSSKRVGSSRTASLQHLRSLTPLQLAAQLGYHDEFKRVLRGQCTLKWKWGDVSEYEIDLRGIDSSGTGGGDVMELICKVSSSKETTEMLLDSFMQGFIFKLFRKKWEHFAWRLHCVRIALDLSIIAITLVVAFNMKQAPFEWRSPIVLPSICVGLSALSVAADAAGVYLYYQNERASVGTKPWTALMDTIQWCRLEAVPIELLGHAVLVVAWVMLLSSSCDFTLSPPPPPVMPPSSPPAAVGRLLRGGGAATSSDTGEDDGYVAVLGSMGDEADAFNVLWPFLALGLLCRISSFTRRACVPFEALNVFVLSVGKMLFNDIATFLVLFFEFVLAFYCAMYILYPHAEGFERLGVVESFERWDSALLSMLQLGFLGVEMEVNLVAFRTQDLTPWQSVDLIIFGFLYIVYILMSIILLLNLLIAMLSFTFESVREDSTLQCRLSFARYVLRLERFTELLGMDIQSGESVDGRPIHVFRAVVGSKVVTSLDNPFADDDEDVSNSHLEEQISELSAAVKAMAAAQQDARHAPGANNEGKVDIRA